MVVDPLIPESKLFFLSLYFFTNRLVVSVPSVAISSIRFISISRESEYMNIRE